MLAVFRVDGSSKLGAGHFMRCFTLAQGLRPHASAIHFISAALDPHLEHLLVEQGFVFHRLTGTAGALEQLPDGLENAFLSYPWREDAEECRRYLKQRAERPAVLIVDGYHLDARWHGEFRALSRCVVAIDDLANRQLDCDILLNQCSEEFIERYAQRVNNAVMLLGPKYALIRSEFQKARLSAAPRDKVGRILIAFGGSPQHATHAVEAVRALSPLFRLGIRARVLSGGPAAYSALAEELCSFGDDVELCGFTDRPADLMLDADIAVGAAGSGVWERACLGIPSVMLCMSANQEAVAERVAAAGAGVRLGHIGEVRPETIEKAVREFAEDSRRLKFMSTSCMELVDGQGGDRVVQAILEKLRR